MSSSVRAHGGSNTRSGSSSCMGGSSFPRHHEPALSRFENHGHAGRFVGDGNYGRTERNYGSIDGVGGSWSMGYRTENVQEELSPLDLSLRL